MKLRPAFFTGLILTGAWQLSAQTVEVNGIVGLFGQKGACFIQPNQPEKKGFMLLEGESHFGVKLLAVDLTGGHVQVEDQGQTFWLRIHATGGFSIPANVAAGLVAAGTGAHESSGGKPGTSAIDVGEQYEIMAGNPGWGTIPAAPINARANNSASPGATGDSSANNEPGSSTSDTGNTASAGSASSDQTQAEWYQESVSIEKSRRETAAQVIAGDETPWPRTPLTPPGTDPRLIGPETFFASHMGNNYIAPGFLNE